MHRSVRTLLARVIDYAGLFPPAQLPMAAAVDEYTALRESPESWMLARFVCPAARLAELAPLAAPAAGPAPFLIAALAGAGESPDDLVAALRSDLEAVAAFDGAGPRRLRVDQVELKLPAELVAAADPGRTAALLGTVEATVGRALPGPALLAAEVPLAGRSRRELEATVAGVARAVAALDPTAGRSICLKLRLGGPTAAAFPSVAEVGAALAVSRDRGVAIKATQGLHHPLPGRDAATGAGRHGFLNLLVAGVLARDPGLTETELVALLAETDGAAFEFDGEGLGWRGRRADLAAIAAGRREGIASFGSCSVAEPRDDLRAMGLLA